MMQQFKIIQCVNCCGPTVGASLTYLATSHLTVWRIVSGGLRGVCGGVLCSDGSRAAAMGAARHASAAHAPAAAASSCAGAGHVRCRPRAGAARAALRQSQSYNGHVTHNTDIPQEPLSSATARWHRQRHLRKQQRLQYVFNIFYRLFIQITSSTYLEVLKTILRNIIFRYICSNRQIPTQTNYIRLSRLRRIE